MQHWPGRGSGTITTSVRLCQSYPIETEGVLYRAAGALSRGKVTGTHPPCTRCVFLPHRRHVTQQTLQRRLMARQGCSLSRWCPCRASTVSATVAVWRRTVCCAGQSSRHHANRGWMRAMPTPGRLAGTGRGCSSGYLLWLWPRAPCADAARSGSLPPSPKRAAAMGEVTPSPHEKRR